MAVPLVDGVRCLKCGNLMVVVNTTVKAHATTTRYECKLCNTIQEVEEAVDRSRSLRS